MRLQGALYRAFGSNLRLVLEPVVFYFCTPTSTGVEREKRMGVWDSLDGERGVTEVVQTGRRKYVCVTGNWSVLGSWLVRNLLEKGYNVRSTLRTTVGNHHLLHQSQLRRIAFLSSGGHGDSWGLSTFCCWLWWCEVHFPLLRDTQRCWRLMCVFLGVLQMRPQL